MKVLLFARARELAGQGLIELRLPAGASVADLRRALADAWPRLAGLAARSALAVNNEYADDSTPIPADAEVALLPPVSGGSS
jgi:molybdopterin converting factor subunit 1